MIAIGGGSSVDEGTALDIEDTKPAARIEESG